MVESACACFRNRLADPACVLSPAFAAWKQPLAAAGLFDAHAHDVVGDPADTVWVDVDGVGLVFARRNGPALLVSPQPQSRAMMDAMPALWSFDARPWIDRVRISALVMAGTADPVVPLDHARAMHEGLPRSRFVAIDGAGHVPTAEQQPRAAEAVQDFMATLA
jgi:pimeloyl-ACP methyl ester carboxylesterase